MHFEHLIEINNPLNPLIETLSREQVWSGLMYRVEEPGIFLPGLDRCEILSRSEGRVERVLHFGQASIRDTVTYRDLEWVCFESRATAQHAGGSLTIRLEAPDSNRLFLRFTYETTLSENAADGEVVQVSEFVKSAYRESDVDTVRIIRTIAANGRPQ
ncbi:SRPBCC family protein [Zoogloea sp.]|uniref:SRPBCC family protein n=1 Tax=Zoogloea sp. TaxID=49181 RepID=UPI0035B3EBC9